MSAKEIFFFAVLALYGFIMARRLRAGVSPRLSALHLAASLVFMVLLLVFGIA